MGNYPWENFQNYFYPENWLSVAKISKNNLSTREIGLKIRPNHVFITESFYKNGVSHGNRPSFKYL